MGLTCRRTGKWIFEFGWNMSETDAALYEAPFRHVKEHARLMRGSGMSNRARYVEGALRLPRHIVTPTVAKHRLFDWLEAGTCSDHQLMVEDCRDDVPKRDLQTLAR